MAGKGEAAAHWGTIARTVDEMVRDGLPPSNAQVRELILKVPGAPPLDGVPEGFARVVREVERYRNRSREPEDDAGPDPQPVPQVQEVAKLLAGKIVVLIGGKARPRRRQALEEAFELKELDWISTREHESVANFEPNVARPDVALVLLCIRWASHSFGQVKEFCDKYGKPLVRLPAGYNPNQVAVQILAQCDRQLAVAQGPSAGGV